MVTPGVQNSAMSTIDSRIKGLCRGGAGAHAIFATFEFSPKEQDGKKMKNALIVDLV